MRPRTGRALIVAAATLLVVLILGRAAVGLYTDLLWYQQLGYLSTFWRRLSLTVGVRGAAATIAAATVFLNLWWVARHLGPVRVRRRYGNIEIAEQVPRKYILALAAIIAVLGGWWLAELQFGDRAVLNVATWVQRVAWGVEDPVFGRDISFYAFTLPFLADGLGFLILVALWTLALVALGHVLVGGIALEENRLTLSRPARLHLAILVAVVLLLLATRYWLGRYLLLIDGTGVGGSFGFTDDTARLPAYWLMVAATSAAAGALLYGAWHNRLLPPVVSLGAVMVLGILATAAYPALVQKFQVEPNELSREAPYIRWHLEATRQAFALDDMERRRFPYRATARPDPTVLERVVARLPLWDPAPLEPAFYQRQSLFQYYGFPDVDFDRYGAPGDEQQVAIGVREFEEAGVEEVNQTWQSLRLNPSYIRGMGAVVAATNPNPATDGQPQLLVRDLDPVVTVAEAPPGLDVERPSVFYGESDLGYAIIIPGRDSAFTGTPGVDFPEGIPLNSFSRVVAFAWRFGDENLLFSGEVSRDSRLIMRRSVRERAEALAPFLRWDSDPLPVIHEGRIVWLLDGYTRSSNYPLARSVSLGDESVRYLRNSVKAAIDAVTGEVQIYRLDTGDPILATWAAVFPDLFRPFEEMPPGLQRHMRYPELALLARSAVLQEYHVARAEIFYAGQNEWDLPDARSAASGSGEYGAFYALVPVPLERGMEYLGMVPFIARRRQNMTGMLLARNSAARYGQLTLLEFPRDQQIPGPGQVQAMIEQDPVIAPELTLVRQRGTDVDMGYLRMVPLDSTILYIQPLFLSAEENAIPELWAVAVSDGSRISMAPSLPAAMARLDLPVDSSTGPGVASDGGAGQRPEGDEPARVGVGGWPQRALDLLERADQRLRQGDWAGYGRALSDLRTYLQSLGGTEEPGS